MAMDIKLPDMGKNMTSGELIRWMKAEGDTVRRGEPIMMVRFQFGKAKIAADASGIITRISAEAGDQITNHDVLGIITEKSDDGTDEMPAAVTETEAAQPEAPAEEKAEEAAPAASEAVEAAEKAEETVAMTETEETVEIDEVEEADSMDAVEEEPAVKRSERLSLRGLKDGKNQSFGGTRQTVRATPAARRYAREKDINLEDLVGCGFSMPFQPRDVDRFIDQREILMKRQLFRKYAQPNENGEVPNEQEILEIIKEEQQKAKAAKEAEEQKRAEEEAKAAEEQAAVEEAAEEEKTVEAQPAVAAAETAAPAEEKHKRPISPLAEAMARAKGVDYTLIETGSGPNGRIMKEDVLKWMEDHPAKKAAEDTVEAEEKTEAPEEKAFSPEGTAVAEEAEAIAEEPEAEDEAAVDEVPVQAEAVPAEKEEALEDKTAPSEDGLDEIKETEETEAIGETEGGTAKPVEELAGAAALGGAALAFEGPASAGETPSEETAEIKETAEAEEPAAAEEAEAALEAEAAEPAEAAVADEEAPGADALDEREDLSTIEAVAVERRAALDNDFVQNDRQGGGSEPIVLTTEIDMTELRTYRKKICKRIEKETGLRCAYTDFFMTAVGKIVGKYPTVNGGSGDAVHCALMVKDDAGIVTPVFRNMDAMELTDVVAKRCDFMKGIRCNRFDKKDFTGATIQVMNLGMYDMDRFSLPLGEDGCAVLCVGCIRDRLRYLKGEPVRRYVMQVTLDLDAHRSNVITGAEFLNELRNSLENPKAFFGIVE